MLMTWFCCFIYKYHLSSHSLLNLLYRCWLIGMESMLKINSNTLTILATVNNIAVGYNDGKFGNHSNYTDI